ncbi:MAG: winged helix-turn-helix transcriptional regulator [Phycisphaerae bacterium]|nr:winged helix-turn-helix transcriptional regulator [Gemmatimonadaceae bacterium]
MLNQRVHRVFHAMGAPKRRMIVERLSRGSVAVSDLAAPLKLTVAAVVQHLQVLEEAGVVRTEKIGRVRTCRLEPSGLLVAEQWMAERRSLWERRLGLLDELLADNAETTKGDTHETHA